MLDPEVMLPAPAQGALSVEARVDDTELVAASAALDDRDARLTATAERAMLASAGGRVPGAGRRDWPTVEDGGERLSLRGRVIRPDGGV